MVLTRLLLLAAELLNNVLLVLVKQLRVKTNVAGLVHAVDVAEACGDREVLGNGAQGLVDGKDVLGLGIEGVVVDILVVDTLLAVTS